MIPRRRARALVVPDRCDACTECGDVARWVVTARGPYPSRPRCDAHSVDGARRPMPASRHPDTPVKR